MPSLRCELRQQSSSPRAQDWIASSQVLLAMTKRKPFFMTTMLASDLPLPRIGRGKVRDIYAVGDDRVLLLTTDRISAFDVVMAETIPMKGAVLTQISAWWFQRLEGVVPHHMISADADEIIRQVPALQGHRAEIAGRAHAVPAHDGVSDRMRDPRLSLRLGVEGIRRAGHAGGRKARAGPARKRKTGAGDLQPGHQGRDRPRREHHGRRACAKSSARR